MRLRKDSHQLFWMAALALVMTLFGCRSEIQTGPGLVFWSSTNPQEIDFSKKYIGTWNAQHPDEPVTFQPVPEGQSSEEVVLAAVVGRTTPDLYANMWQGDVEDYARSGVLIQLDTLDGFMDFMYARCDTQVIREITSTDGHIYQVPWKVNPIMMMYNPRLFEQAGVDSVSTRYSGIEASGEILAKKGVLLGISEVNAIWWQRFFNFLPLYYAASDGSPLVQNGKAMFNNKYGVEVFRFLQALYQNGYFPKEQLKGQADPFLAEKVAITFTGSWTIEHNEKFKGPDLRYAFSEVPVPDDHEGPVYTYGDPKNIVMFNTCRNPQLAWRFLQTLLTEQADLDFMMISRQIPRRKDLTESPQFFSYLSAHPELMPFAKQAKYVKGMDSARYMKEVLDLISQEYESCVVYGLQTPEEAVRKAAEAVNLLYYE